MQWKTKNKKTSAWCDAPLPRSELCSTIPRQLSHVYHSPAQPRRLRSPYISTSPVLRLLPRHVYHRLLSHACHVCYSACPCTTSATCTAIAHPIVPCATCVTCDPAPPCTFNASFHTCTAQYIGVHVRRLRLPLQKCGTVGRACALRGARDPS